VSTPLAISAVTAAIRNLLTVGVHADSELSDADITTAPPSKAPKNDAKNEINLFLYSATPNAGWSNLEPPTARPGENGRPLLALDLHYLLTVHGKGFDEVLSHRLLGRAMRVLHDHPVLGRDEIDSALNGEEVGDQVERVRITPEPLTLDEMSKLWSSFQTEYRMSTAYQATVVLIESERTSPTPLPVLTRGEGDAGPVVVPEPAPPFPTLVRAEPPGGEDAALLGETVTLRGHHLEEATTARLAGRRIAEPLLVPLLPGTTADSASVRLPTATTVLPAGLYALSILAGPGDENERETNAVGLAVAPELLSVAPNPAARNAGGDVTLGVTCRPEVRPEQAASLLLGGREIRAEPHPVGSATLTFEVVRARPGQPWLRLRVDGVDSRLVDRTVSPPVFDPTQRVTIT
jgi:Pvc16 N-terminal domain